MKEYVGYIWIGDAPGTRISVWAEDSAEAMRLVEAEYGTGHPYSIANLDDAENKIR
ncbi:MAG TPA: hypothetical protein VF228_23845 [Iamia sp.]